MKYGEVGSELLKLKEQESEKDLDIYKELFKYTHEIERKNKTRFRILCILAAISTVSTLILIINTFNH